MKQEKVYLDKYGIRHTLTDANGWEILPTGETWDKNAGVAEEPYDYSGWDTVRRSRVPYPIETNIGSSLIKIDLHTGNIL